MKLPFGIGLIEKTNCTNAIVLASWHHPKSITWRFSLWAYFQKSIAIKFGKHNRNVYLKIPFLYLSLNVQDHMFLNKE